MVDLSAKYNKDIILMNIQRKIYPTLTIDGVGVRGSCPVIIADATRWKSEIMGAFIVGGSGFWVCGGVTVGLPAPRDI